MLSSSMFQTPTWISLFFPSRRLAMLRRVDAASAWVRGEKELGTEPLAHLHVTGARNKLCYFRYREFQDACYLNLPHPTESAANSQEEVIMSKHSADCTMREWDWVHKSSKLGAMLARQTETNNLQHLSLLTRDEKDKGKEWTGVAWTPVSERWCSQAGAAQSTDNAAFHGWLTV